MTAVPAETRKLMPVINKHLGQAIPKRPNIAGQSIRGDSKGLTCKAVLVKTALLRRRHRHWCSRHNNDRCLGCRACPAARASTTQSQREQYRVQEAQTQWEHERQADQAEAKENHPQSHGGRSRTGTLSSSKDGS